MTKKHLPPSPRSSPGGVLGHSPAGLCDSNNISSYQGLGVPSPVPMVCRAFVSSLPGLRGVSAACPWGRPWSRACQPRRIPLPHPENPGVQRANRGVSWGKEDLGSFWRQNSSRGTGQPKDAPADAVRRGHSATLLHPGRSTAAPSRGNGKSRRVSIGGCWPGF